MKKEKMQNSNKLKSATGGNEKKLTIKTKAIIYVSIFVIFIVLMAIGGLVWNIYQDKNPENTTVELENRWDSDAKLIDDRLNENDPIFFIISPTMIDGTQFATAITIYNNGYKVSELLKFDSYDDFMEQLNQKTAFVEDLRTYYEVFSESENTHSESQDIKPLKIRDIYLKQYLIDDFSVKTTINMTNSKDESIVYIYGVTYDENLEATSHLYYGSTDSTTIEVTSESAISFFGDFTRFYSDSMSSNEQ